VKIPSLPLNTKNLPALATRLRVPQYDRRLLQPAIVHIGVGGFNRAHQALYLDDLLHRAETERWGECGLGLLPADRQIQQVLRTQDFLYTAVERSAESLEARVVGSLCDMVFAPANSEAAIEKMASPECRIVSLTITEGSYLLDAVTGKFNEKHPDVLHDLANPRAPRTFLGYLTEALERRRTRGLPPFTVLSCDNLPGNGHVTRLVVTSFADRKHPALRRWIEENVTFPNSMVDRITPATTDADRELIRERFGLEDAWPVVAEPYRQWVLEDTFCNGRPAWELAGVQFTPDVTPFERMKVRLLNGSHFALAYPGALLGFEFVHEVLADDLLRRYIQAFMNQVTPLIPVLPGTNLAEYKAILLQRFSNPTLRDQITRVCAQGSSKLSKFILPSLEELLQRHLPVHWLVLVVASWLHYSKGRDEQGRVLEIRDEAACTLQQQLLASGSDAPLGRSTLEFVLGPRLSRHPGLVQQLQAALSRLAREGVRVTLERYLRTPPHTASSELVPFSAIHGDLRCSGPAAEL
jgi:mannitol 2-dehydrogenase